MEGRMATGVASWAEQEVGRAVRTLSILSPTARLAAAAGPPSTDEDRLDTMANCVVDKVANSDQTVW